MAKGKKSAVWFEEGKVDAKLTRAQRAAISHAGKLANRMTKYLDHLKAKISAPIPKKHAHRPNQYKQYLEIELRKAEARMPAP